MTVSAATVFTGAFVISVAGSLTQSASLTLSGGSSVKLDGTGTWNCSVNTAFCQGPVVINSAGIITLQTIYTTTTALELTYTAGTIVNTACNISGNRCMLTVTGFTGGAGPSLRTLTGGSSASYSIITMGSDLNLVGNLAHTATAAIDHWFQIKGAYTLNAAAMTASGATSTGYMGITTGASYPAAINITDVLFDNKRCSLDASGCPVNITNLAVHSNIAGGYLGGTGAVGGVLTVTGSLKLSVNAAVAASVLTVSGNFVYSGTAANCQCYGVTFSTMNFSGSAATVYSWFGAKVGVCAGCEIVTQADLGAAGSGGAGVSVANF